MPLVLNGTTGASMIQSNTVTSDKLSGVAGAVAWVNFNGTGTVAIRSAFNVSGVTDNGTGTYTVTLATGQSTNTYCCVSHVIQSDGGQSGVFLDGTFIYNRTTNSFKVDALNDSSSVAARTDMEIIDIVVFA